MTEAGTALPPDCNAAPSVQGATLLWEAEEVQVGPATCRPGKKDCPLEASAVLQPAALPAGCREKGPFVCRKLNKLYSDCLSRDEVFRTSQTCLEVLSPSLC